MTNENAAEENVFRIVIGNKLTLSLIWKNICKKTNQKLSALGRTSKKQI